MSIVLGVSGLYHDAAAALVVHGEVRGALQQERLSRQKGDPRLPCAAAKALLRDAGLTAADVDAVVFYENPYARLEHVLVSTLRGFPRTWRQFPRAMAAQLSHKVWVKDALADGLGVDRARVHHGEHHESHAASAYFASGAPKAAVLCIDGVGEDTSTSMWRGDGASLRVLARQRFPHSVGLFYAALTAWLGFRVLEGEQQVMGLSALGSPTRLEEMHRLARLHDDGSIELSLDYFAHHTDDVLGYSDALVELLGPPRPAGRPWPLDEHGGLRDDNDRRYADVAASLQRHTEAILLALARQARALCPDVDTLCLAGGVALNACGNSVVAHNAGFSRVFVQPAAGDAGGALGAAWCIARARGDVPRALAHAALGPALSASTLVPLATASGLVATPCTPGEVVKRVWRGQVVALVDGRAEWGPRALGHRSLLAAPGPHAVKDHINVAIKRREPFRPFAPAVIDDALPDWFDDATPDLARFMTGVATTKPAQREALGAVTHHDGSARVQSVDVHAPALRAILQAARDAGHPPVLLNTSLNGRSEPICHDATDVVRFFLSHPDVNAVVVDDVVLTRP